MATEASAWVPCGMVRPTRHQAGPALVIPDHELEFRASRSSGPGGQHVNKASTRVEVRWNIPASSAPTAPQRALLLDRLASRLDASGNLRVTASASRSQWANRQAATERLLDLVTRALEPTRTRRPTGIPPAERRRRLEAKRHRGAVKRERRRVTEDD